MLNIVARRVPSRRCRALFIAALLAAVRASADEQSQAPAPSNVPVTSPEEQLPKQHERHELEVVVTQEKTAGEAASRLHVGRRELELRPKRDPAEILEATPGLFVAQHAGGGKANQYFLRGFDADHGTDVAFFVDGVPVNNVSHAHGQGYSDLHFLIPELVVGLDVYKGPYYAEFGDFATAGALNLQLAETFPENAVSYSAGQYGSQRGLVVAAPALGEHWRSVLAAEIYKTDGPFAHAEGLRRFNVFARSTLDFGDRSKLSLTLMTHGSDWHGSGQIPARAVCGEGQAGVPRPEAFGQKCIDRFDAIDPSEGGQTARHMLSAAYSRVSEDSDFSTLVYVLKYDLNLYSNFTFFARNPLQGDGIEQSDDRVTYGADVRARRHVHFGQSKFTTSFGTQLRADTIDNALYDQTQRERTAARVDARVRESQIGMYVQEDARLLPELRFIVGARLQHIAVRVADRLEDEATLGTRSSGTKSELLLLPKFSAILSPVPSLQLFGHFGRGFHSNDARGAVLTSGAVSLLTPALGYEVGVRCEPFSGIELHASGFLLDLASEQVWVGDEGTTEASGRTRRLGLELGARAQVGNWLFADIDATFTRARYRDEGRADRVPLAPVRTLSAGIAARHALGSFIPFGSLRVKALADRPANEDGSLSALGYTLLDAALGLRYRNIEAALDVQNVLDTKWREVSFASTSRLAYEPAPVTGIHYTPGWPRTFMARGTLYWD